MIKGCAPGWAAGINQNTEYQCDEVSAVTNLGACPGDDGDYDKWNEEGKRLMEDERRYARTSVNVAVEVYGRIQLAVCHFI